MKTITEQSKIEIDYNSAENHEGAYATCRCLPGQYEQENMQEWAEDCTIDGAPAKIYYLFENAECESEDAEDYPWDSEHVSKIEIEEEDEDNEINTHTNKNGEKYYSKEGENGEMIFSFSEDFRDTWSQEDEDLYGESK